MSSPAIRALTAAFALLLAAPAAFAQATTFSRHLAAPATGEVQISNVAGSVVVRTWDRAEIDVKAKLRSGQEKVEVTQQGDRTVVEVVYPETLFGTRSSAEVEVTLPANSRVDVSTVSASIDAKGLRGASRLRSVSGGIESNVPAAAFEVKSVSGGVRLRGDRGKSDLRVSTVSGGAEVAASAGSVDARSTSGSLTLDLDPADRVHARSTSGRVDVTGRLARDGQIELETVSGALSVRAKAADGFRYDVATLSGNIENCLDATPVRQRSHGPGRTLDGTRGAGQGTVRLKTLSGSIELCDR